jgi:hypothetical protein
MMDDRLVHAAKKRTRPQKISAFPREYSNIGLPLLKLEI